MALVADVTKFAEMAHQVGGHATTKTSLKSFNGQILKPFQSKNRGEHENAFYDEVFNANANDTLRSLRPFLPDYGGSVTVEEHEVEGSTMHGGKFLVLEDLTWGRKSPCIMDVKVGTRSFEDGAPPEKIAYERQKFPLQEQVGFRIQGIKVFRPDTKDYIEYDKHFGRSFTDLAAIRRGFGNYFAHLPPSARRGLLQLFIGRLESIRGWFEQQQQCEFIASSLLFLYNGDVPVSELAVVSDEALGQLLQPDIRLIDFAHVQRFTTPQRDVGVLLGVTTTIQCFRELLIEVSPAH